MDMIKEKINEVVKKVKSDKKFSEKFKKDPVKAVEGVLGVDLPDDVINKIIEGVKAKLTVDTANDAINKIKGLFDKK